MLAPEGLGHAMDRDKNLALSGPKEGFLSLNGNPCEPGIGLQGGDVLGC